jgi:hypothetical protein
MMQVWRNFQVLSEEISDTFAFLSVVCVLKCILSCEQNSSFSIFQSWLTATWFSSVYCTAKSADPQLYLWHASKLEVYIPRDHGKCHDIPMQNTKVKNLVRFHMLTGGVPADGVGKGPQFSCVSYRWNGGLPGDPTGKRQGSDRVFAAFTSFSREFPALEGLRMNVLRRRLPSQNSNTTNLNHHIRDLNRVSA